MYNLEDIKTIHLEVTQNCQASCPMCDRNINGGEVNPHINLDELTLEDCKKIFTPEFISQLSTMYMCGNLGDPLIARDTLEIFRYFRNHNPNIWFSMNTNGGARDRKWWTDLANVFDKKGAVIFSVDGLKDTNHIYRQGVTWSLVEQNIKTFISAGGRARWDFLVFDHNQHQIEEAQNLANNWGVEKFIVKKTGRFITANSIAKEIHFVPNKNSLIKKPEEKYQNSALKNQESLIGKHGSMDVYYDSAVIECKVSKEKSLFITAEGLALPCCWTAGRMYKWWHTDPKVEQIWQFIDQVGGKSAIDARQGLEKVFKSGIFDKIKESWSKKSCADGKLKVCSMKCGTEFDPFKSQFE
jgi:MoaA/NifB/PqqE/SkfB family radical SAM enzyme